MIIRINYPATASGKKQWARDYGLNSYWSGKHWSKRKADAEYWHELVRTVLRGSGIAHTPYDGPVALSFKWNDRLDLSNHAAMAKMIEDALKGVVIRDDGRKWVRRISHEWWDEDAIEVTVTPLEGGD